MTRRPLTCFQKMSVGSKSSALALTEASATVNGDEGTATFRAPVGRGSLQLPGVLEHGQQCVGCTPAPPVN